ncbi:MAG: methionine synthase [Oscillospiraceae bacterium]|nr:methionine synthase [Oscillospiraceae bacterium]
MTLDLSEAARLAGLNDDAPEELRERLRDTALKLQESVTPRYLYRVYPLRPADGGIGLTGSGITLTGETAERMLQGCDRAALLACTLGAGFDAMLRREQARDMSRAVLLDACGSAWVEAGCDEAEAELQERFPDSYLTDRFSPGYGDLPLSLQKGICDALDAGKRLGLSLTESFLLNPVKSVTAVIGISPKPQPARIRGCEYCAMGENCAFRKEGGNCGR